VYDHRDRVHQMRHPPETALKQRKTRNRIRQWRKVGRATRPGHVRAWPRARRQQTPTSWSECTVFDVSSDVVVETWPHEGPTSTSAPRNKFARGRVRTPVVDCRLSIVEVLLSVRSASSVLRPPSSVLSLSESRATNRGQRIRASKWILSSSSLLRRKRNGRSVRRRILVGVGTR